MSASGSIDVTPAVWITPIVVSGTTEHDPHGKPLAPNEPVDWTANVSSFGGPLRGSVQEPESALVLRVAGEDPAPGRPATAANPDEMQVAGHTGGGVVMNRAELPPSAAVRPRATPSLESSA